MKKLLNLKNIAIAVLIAIILLEYFNPGGKEKCQEELSE
jgi:hypothetical protein